MDNTDQQLSIQQYLTFFLAEEEYGIDILHVLEIRGWEATTPLPDAPAYMKGIINLRGNIIPVIDLRVRFDQPSIEYGPLTVCIVLQVVADGVEKTMGMVVDAVSDVYSLDKAWIQNKPEICDKSAHEYIEGLVSIKERDKNDKMVILLDTNRLLSVAELEHLY